MKKKKEQPKQVEDLAEFQSTYGADWFKITQMPAFRAGLQLLNVRELDRITSLSDEEIDKHAGLILSQLIGLLRHENNIFNLHKEKSFEFPSTDDDIYVSPEEQAEHEIIRAKFADQTKKQRYA